MAKRVRIKILDKRVLDYGLPKPATPGSAAVDIRVLLDTPLLLQPGERQLLRTGIAVHIQDKNYAAMLLPRSGLSHKHGLILGNTVGLIDSDYQGELNISCYHSGDESYVLQPGERIAQLLLVAIRQIEFELTDAFEESERGEGGYGHTGKV